MERYVVFSVLYWAFLIAAEDRKALWLNRFIPKNYSSGTPPVKLTGPAEVTTYLAPFGVTHMLMKEMEFVVDVVVFLSWYDDRLNMPGNEDISDSDYILPEEYASRVWVPFLLFYNSKGRNANLIDIKTTIFLTHGYFTKNNSIHLRVFYRESFHFVCHFIFYAYPFDKQECHMMLVSGDKAHEVHLKIINYFPGRTFDHITVPPEFRLHFFGQKDCTRGSYDARRFTCQRFVFVFHRIYAHHMMTLFIPSILIVILSWISFWIEISASAPRVTLGLTSLLTLATQFSSAQKDLPSVADVKAIDIWMFTCMFMVFASLVEFAMANYKRPTPKSNVVNVACAPKQLTPKHSRMCKRPKKNKAFLSKFKLIFTARKNKELRCLFWPSSTNRIDLAARVIFPVFFLIFNVVFWMYYLGKR